MKKLFLKFGLLVLIAIILSQIALMSMPFSWGNIRLNTKYETYVEDNEKYNTLFIGASTTYRHINPSEFDSIVNAQRPELNIKSFNFGIPANRTPQSVFMLENLISYDKANIKYVVIDLSELTKMGADNLHKKEMIFWYTPNNILDVMKASWESEKGITKKVSVPCLHAFSFCEKSLLIGMGPALVQQQSGLNYDIRTLGPDRNGFYSLDQEMIDDPDGDLASRYSELRTQDTIDYRTKRCQFLFDKYKTAEKNPNKTIEKNLTDLISYCEKNDIKIVIMLSQRLGDRYEYLIPLFNQLPEENRIGFQDPSAYPMFNDRNNLFDLAHLNAPGAKIFTEIFAGEFLQRIDMQNGVQPSKEEKKDQYSKDQNPDLDDSL
ncbi:MAG: hypothetical protein ACHQFW_05115 [Chitinophagales bacterium]